MAITRFTCYLLLAVLVLTSCKSSEVASDGWIQKRKYRKGFHIDAFGKKKEQQKVFLQGVASDLNQDIESGASQEHRSLPSLPNRKLSKKPPFVGFIDTLKKSNGLNQRTIVPSTTDTSRIKHKRKGAYSYEIGDDYFGEDEDKDLSTQDTYALIAFISAILALFLPLIGIAAFIFGLLGRKSERRKWMAIVGIVVGSIMVFLIFLLILYLLLLFFILL